MKVGVEPRLAVTASIGVVTASLIGIFSMSSAFAQACTPATWKAFSVQSNFRGDKAREQLSGAACDETLSRCIAVNDEKEYAQFFAISGTAITPGTSFDFAKGGEEPDAEGAAFAGGYFYVAGSHGNSRKKNNPNAASYVVARIDAKSGLVDGSSTKWRGAISRSAKLGPYAAQPLKNGGPDNAGGANAEGVAVWKDRMYLGFRGPSVRDTAYILSAALGDVFTSPEKDMTAADHEIKLGPRAGIRDLAAVQTGLLILSGPVNDEAVTPSIFHWNPETNKLDMLVQLAALPASTKVETIVVLRDGADQSQYQVLLLFEGAKNGRPVECSLPKPK